MHQSTKGTGKNCVRHIRERWGMRPISFIPTKQNDFGGVEQMPDTATYTYLINKYGLTMTFEQAAELLGIYKDTVRVLCKQGKINTQRAGYKWILTTRAIADFIDNGSAPREEQPIQFAGKPRYKKIV